MRAEDDGVDALRHAHRAASNALDVAPGASVRAAVLAAAARDVDARAFRPRRWPLSAAALLVVSIITGLVATRVMRSNPERATTIASVAPARATDSPPAEPPGEPPTPAPAVPPPAATAAIATPRPVPPRQATRNEVRSHDLRIDADRATPSTAIVAAPARETAPPAAAPQTPSIAKTEASADAVSREANTPAPDADASSSLRASTAMRSRIGRTAEPASAEAWVERIARLRADGNDIEADHELDGLRQRYPGFVIPASALRASGTR